MKQGLCIWCGNLYVFHLEWKVKERGMPHCPECGRQLAKQTHHWALNTTHKNPISMEAVDYIKRYIKTIPDTMLHDELEGRGYKVAMKSQKEAPYGSNQPG